MNENDDKCSRTLDMESQRVLNLNMESQAQGKTDFPLAETPPPSISEATTPVKRIKRGHKAYVSPLKPLKPKTPGEQRTNTYVFFDTETTGLFPQDSNWRDDKMSDPNMASANLGRYIAETSLSDYPRITEMSFVAVPRPIFENGIRMMNEKDEQDKETVSSISLKQRISANSYTAQVNPQLSEAQWLEYENKRKASNNVIHLSRYDLEHKSVFATEWKSVCHFLENLLKPACLVAHNGLRFDYRVLYGELQRAGFENPMLDGLTFADSLYAFREIDQNHQKEMHKVVGLVDWKTISDHISLTRSLESNHEKEKSEERDMFEETCGYDVDALMNDGERTPERPIPSRGTSSEPSKLSSRRALFTRAQPMLPLREDHPLLYLNTDKWSPAKKKRVQQQFFVRSPCGSWNFDNVSAENDLRKRGNYSLGSIYKKMVNEDFEAHYAQDDCHALLQVSMAYGMDFVNYIDRMGADFPF